MTDRQEIWLRIRYRIRVGVTCLESEAGDPPRGGPGDAWTARARLEGPEVSPSWASGDPGPSMPVLENLPSYKVISQVPGCASRLV